MEKTALALRRLEQTLDALDGDPDAAFSVSERVRAEAERLAKRLMRERIKAARAADLIVRGLETPVPVREFFRVALDAGEPGLALLADFQRAVEERIRELENAEDRERTPAVREVSQC